MVKLMATLKPSWLSLGLKLGLGLGWPIFEIPNISIHYAHTCWCVPWFEGRRQDLPCYSTENVELGKVCTRFKPNPCATNSTVVSEISQLASQEICLKESVQPSLAQLWDQLYRSSTRRESLQMSFSLTASLALEEWGQNHPGTLSCEHCLACPCCDLRGRRTDGELDQQL